MNISDWLVRNASREPGGTAIHFEGRTITHGELLPRVEAFVRTAAARSPDSPSVEQLRRDAGTQRLRDECVDDVAVSR